MHEWTLWEAADAAGSSPESSSGVRYQRELPLSELEGLARDWDETRLRLVVTAASGKVAFNTLEIKIKNTTRAQQQDGPGSRALQVAGAVLFLSLALSQGPVAQLGLPGLGIGGANQPRFQTLREQQQAFQQQAFQQRFAFQQEHAFQQQRAFEDEDDEDQPPEVVIEGSDGPAKVTMS